MATYGAEWRRIIDTPENRLKLRQRNTGDFAGPLMTRKARRSDYFVEQAHIQGLQTRFGTDQLSVKSIIMRLRSTAQDKQHPFGKASIFCTTMEAQ